MPKTSVNSRVEGDCLFRTRSVTCSVHYTQQSLFDLPTAPQQHLLLQPVPRQLTVGEDDRFWLIESVTGLRIPGQFTRAEADFIWEITQHWNWEVESTTREPACRVQLMRLLEEVCAKTQLTLGNVPTGTSLCSFDQHEEVRAKTQLIRGVRK